MPLKAAAYHLQGLIAYNLQDYTTASTAFNEALKIEPKFALATQNANAVAVEIQNARSNVKPQTNSNSRGNK